MHGHDEDGRLDLVPMIDCIMLLLLFFMMTTKFTADEKAINQVLSTQDGNARAPSREPPPQVTIRVAPAGLPVGADPGTCGRWWADGRAGADVTLRIGGREPIVIHGDRLSGPPGPAQMAEVEAIHRQVAEALAPYEVPGATRDHQPEVLIKAFSGLGWKHALVVFDAIRAYEAQVGKITWTGDPAELAKARGVRFASPPLRNGSPEEIGVELAELARLH